jgi:hypothetical protein
VLLVVHVDLDLLGRLGVGDGIAVADLDLGAVLRAGAEQGTDDALLVGGAADRVVEDGEDGLGGELAGAQAGVFVVVVWAHLGLDDDVERGGRGLGADGGRAEGAGEVEEGVVVGHGGGEGEERARGVERGERETRDGGAEGC